jgi:hypothetical protein
MQTAVGKIQYKYIPLPDMAIKSCNDIPAIFDLEATSAAWIP